MNPFAPPTTDVDLKQPASRKPVAFVLLGLCALQLLWWLRWMPGYLELVRTGATNYATAFTSLVGCILLYVAAARFAANASRGHRRFIAAFVLLAWSTHGWERGWGLQYPWTYPYVLGAALAVAGGWFSRPRKDQGRAETPP